MSDTTNETFERDDDFWRLPEQDFSPLGIDEQTADLLRADIHTNNPNRYQNAGIWAGLILESAIPIARATSLNQIDNRQLVTYLWNAVVEPIKEGDSALDSAKDFTHILDSNPLSTSGSYRPDEYSFSSYRTPKYRADTVAEYIERKLEYDDLGAEARTIVEKLKQEADTTPAELFILAAGSLEQMIARRAEITTNERYGGSSRRYWSRHDSGPSVTESTYEDDRWFNEQHAYVEQKGDSLDAVERVLAMLGPVDKDLHLKIGAKAANLARLKDAVDLLKNYDSLLGDTLEVPTFMTVPTEAYDAWLAGAKLTDLTLQIRDWIHANGSDKAYIVRSSAVHSEDGEHTGAGVYESVLLPEGPKTIDIFKAVATVYRSTHSENARSYRQSIGIIDEKMGLIIQEVPDGALDAGAYVTVDTVMPHVPQLVNYSIEQGAHPLQNDGGMQRRSLPLSREGVLLEFGTDYRQNAEYAKRFHVPPDTYVHSLRDSWRATQAAFFAEKVFGVPVQVELIIAEDRTADAYTEKAHLVQARPLPEDMLIPHNFSGFPEGEEHWYHGKSVGVYDGVEATVVQHGYIGKHRDWIKQDTAPGHKIITYTDSYGMGRLAGDIAQVLQTMTPEEKKEIICLITERPGNNGSGYGHLETLFAEMGVGLVFYDGATQSRWEKLVLGQKVRVYSNGYEAKLYASTDDPAYVEAKKHTRTNDWDDDLDDQDDN